MAIILRTNKEVALTYNEMDKNYSQFFFSASKEGTGTLRLWYTGSSNLGSEFLPGRYIDINLNSGSEAVALTPGGIQGSVQYNAGGGLLGGSSNFYYNSASIQLGLNTSDPSGSLHIVAKDTSTPSTIRLEGLSSGVGKRAYTEFSRAGSVYATLGLSTDSTDIYQNTYTGNRFQIDSQDKLHITSTGIGIYPNTANYATPNQTLTVVGSIGVGTTVTDTNQSVIKQLASEANPGIAPTVAALLIEGQKNKGSVIIGLTTDSGAAEAFAVIRRNIGGTYNAKVATIYSNGNTELSGSLLVRDLATTTANLGSAVVATSTGTLKKIDAAPVPKGGIIMWSGAVVDIPTGWALCDGTNSTPNLVDKFVVGAGSTYSVNNTGGSANAVVVSHTHTGTVDTTTLTGAATYISETWNAHGTATGIFAKQAGYPQGGTPSSVDTSNAGRLSIDASHSHTFTTDSTGESGTNKNLPPYWALAYIMYKGI